MTSVWNIFGSDLMPAIHLDAQLMLDRIRGARVIPFRRSKHTVAQDRRAAAKRRAVKLAKKRGRA